MEVALQPRKENMDSSLKLSHAMRQRESKAPGNQNSCRVPTLVFRGPRSRGVPDLETPQSFSSHIHGHQRTLVFGVRAVEAFAFVLASLGIPSLVNQLWTPQDPTATPDELPTAFV